MSVTRMTRMVGFSIPPAMAEELERMADEEQRTKSELFREMFRVYRNYRLQKQQEGTSLDRPKSPTVEEAQAPLPTAGS
jgi:metal-responsive CopG/Arc/MetJ family transcriptional regulator